MKNHFPFLLPLLLLASCGHPTLVDETHPFDNNRWMRFEPELFSVPVRNTDASHSIILTLLYDTTLYNAKALPLVVDFYADSNERHNFTPSIKLIDLKGNRRGTLLDNYCTVSDTIDRNRYFNQRDTYTYRIKQRTSKYQIDGICSLNFKVIQN